MKKRVSQSSVKKWAISPQGSTVTTRRKTIWNQLRYSLTKQYFKLGFVELVGVYGGGWNRRQNEQMDNQHKEMASFVNELWIISGFETEGMEY